MAVPSPFQYEDYKRFVRDWVKAQPSGGRGLFRKMARHLRVHSTLVSQVFRGERDLNPEQTLRLAQFLGLDLLETDFLLMLADFQRTSSPDLKATIARRLKALRREHQKVRSRLGSVRTLSDREKSRFYSNWFYSAIRLATGIQGLQDGRAIAQRLQLPEATVQDVLDFLAAHDLVTLEHGLYLLGPTRTHISNDSPLVATHHRNWRLKAAERHPLLDADELAFSAPMTLSTSDLTRVRQLLLELIQGVDRIVRNSPSETLAFLNLDLIKM